MSVLPHKSSVSSTTQVLSTTLRTAACHLPDTGDGPAWIPFYQRWVLSQDIFAFLFFLSGHISSWALTEANRSLSDMVSKELGKQLEHWFDF